MTMAATGGKILHAGCTSSQPTVVPFSNVFPLLRAHRINLASIRTFAYACDWKASRMASGNAISAVLFQKGISVMCWTTSILKVVWLAIFLAAAQAGTAEESLQRGNLGRYSSPASGHSSPASGGQVETPKEPLQHREIPPADQTDREPLRRVVYHVADLLTPTPILVVVPSPSSMPAHGDKPAACADFRLAHRVD